jgi:HAD superfamily hydrolase (TIGR01490 family)
MAAEKQITVAAFDFDGTITYCDTLIPFLAFVVGKVGFVCRLLLLTPRYLAFKCGRLSNHDAKEAFLRVFLKGSAYGSLQSAGDSFAMSVLPRLVRRQMLGRIAWHKSQGHVCILVSASLDVYLEAWGRRNGFDAVISSQLEIDPQGIVTGRLAGPNCYGSEKARRLNTWLRDKSLARLYAYGDSRGDFEMLGLADNRWYKGKPLAP